MKLVSKKLSPLKIHLIDMGIWGINVLLVFPAMGMMLAKDKFNQRVEAVILFSIICVFLVSIIILLLFKIKIFYCGIFLGTLGILLYYVELGVIIFSIPITMIISICFKFINLYKLEIEDWKWKWYKPANLYFMIPLQLMIVIFLVWTIVARLP